MRTSFLLILPKAVAKMWQLVSRTIKEELATRLQGRWIGSKCGEFGCTYFLDDPVVELTEQNRSEIVLLHTCILTLGVRMAGSLAGSQIKGVPWFDGLDRTLYADLSS